MGFPIFSGSAEIDISSAESSIASLSSKLARAGQDARTVFDNVGQRIDPVISKVNNLSQTYQQLALSVEQIKMVDQLKGWEVQLDALELKMNRLFRAGSQFRDIGFSLLVNGTMLSAFTSQLAIGAEKWDFWHTKALTALQDNSGYMNTQAGIDTLNRALEQATQAVGAFTPEQVNQAWYYFHSALGLSIKDVHTLNDEYVGLVAVMKSAVIGNVDPTEAARGVAQILQDFKMPLVGTYVDASGTTQAVNNVKRIADSFQYLENVSNVTFGEIIQNFKMLGQFPADLGMTFDQVAALEAVVSQIGTKGSAAGRATVRELQGIEVPSAKALKILDQLAQATTDGAMKWNEYVNSVNASGQRLTGAEGPIDILKTIADAESHMTSAQQAQLGATLMTANGLRVFLPIITDIQKGSDSMFKKYLEDLQNVDKLNLYAAGNWDKFASTIKVAFGSAMEPIRAFGNEIGLVIAQTVIPFIRWIDTIIQSIRSWAQANPDLFHTIIQVVLALTGLLVAGGTALMLFGQLIDFFVLIRLAAVAFTGVLTEMAAGVGALLFTLAPLIAVILALKLAWQNNFLGFRDTMMSFIDDVKAAVSGFMTAITALMHAFGDVINGDWTQLWVDVKEAFFSAAAGIVEIAADLVNDVVAWFGKLGQNILDGLNNIFPGAKQAGENLIAQLVNGLIDGANTMLVGALNQIGGVFAQFFEGHSPPVAGPLREIDTWGTNLIKTWAGGVSKGAALAKAAAHDVATAMSGPLEGHSPTKEGALSEIDQWGSNLFTALMDGMSQADLSPLNAAVDRLVTYFTPNGTGPLGNIAEMGRKTFEQYLQGFTHADFTALNQIMGMVKEDLTAMVDSKVLSKGAAYTSMMNSIQTAVAGVISEIAAGKTITMDMLGPITTLGPQAAQDILNVANALSTLSGLQGALDSLTNSFNAFVNPLKGQVQALQQQLDNLKTAYDTLVAPLEAQKGVLQGLIDADNERIRILNDSIAPLENQKTLLDEQIAPLEYANQLLDQQKITANDSNSALKDRSATIQDQNTTLKDQSATIQGQSTTLKDQSATLQDQNATLKDRSATLQGQNSTLQDQSAIIQDQSAAFKDRNSTLQDQSATLKDQNATLDDQLNTLHEQDAVRTKSYDTALAQAQALLDKSKNPYTQVVDLTSATGQEEMTRRASTMRTTDYQKWLEYEIQMGKAQETAGDPVRTAQEAALNAQKQANADQILAVDAQVRANDAAMRVNDAALRVIDAQKRSNDAALRVIDAQTRVNDAALRVIDTQVRANDAALRVIDAQTRVNDAALRVIDAQTRANDAALRVIDAEERANTEKINGFKFQQATITAQEQSVKNQIDLINMDVKAQTSKMAGVDAQIKADKAAYDLSILGITARKAFLEEEIKHAQFIYDLEKQALDSKIAQAKDYLQQQTDIIAAEKAYTAASVGAAATAATAKKVGAVAGLPSGTPAAAATAATGPMEILDAKLIEIQARYKAIKEAITDIITGKPLPNESQADKKNPYRDGNAQTSDLVPPSLYKVQDFVDKLRPHIVAALQEMGRAWTAFTTGMSADTDTSTLTRIALVMHGLLDALEYVWIKLKEIDFKGPLSAIFGSVSAIWDDIKAVFDGKNEALGDPSVAAALIIAHLKDIIHTVENLILTVLPAASPIKELLDGWFHKDAGDTSPGIAHVIADVIFKGLLLAVNIVAQLAPMIAAHLGDAFNSIIDFLLEKFPAIRTKFDDGVKGLFDKIEIAMPFLAPVFDFLKGLEDAVVRLTDWILPKLRGHAVELGIIFGIFSTGIGKLVLGAITGVIGGVFSLVQSLGGILGGFSAVGQFLQNTFGELISGVGKTLESIGGQILKLGGAFLQFATGGVSGGITGMIGAVGELISSVGPIALVVGLIIALKDNVDGIREKIGVFLSDMQTKLAPLAPLASALVEAFLQIGKVLLGLSAIGAAKVLELLMDIITKLVDVIAPRLATLIGPINDFVNGLKSLTEPVTQVQHAFGMLQGAGGTSAPNPLFERISKIISNLGDVFKELEPVLTTVFSLLGPIIDLLFEVGKIVIGGAFDALLTIIEQIVAVLKFLAPAVSAIVVLLGSVLRPIIIGVTDALRFLEPVLMAVLSFVLQTLAFDGLFKVIGKGIETVMDVIGQVPGRLSGLIDQIAGGLGKGVKNLVSGFSKEAGMTLRSNIEDLGAEVADGLNNFMANVEKFFSSLGPNILKAVEGLGYYMVGPFVHAFDVLFAEGSRVIGGFGGRIGPEVGKIFKSILPWLDKAFTDLVEWLFGGIIGWGEMLIKLPKYLFDEFMNAMKTVWSAIGPLVGQLLDAALKGLADFPGKVVEFFTDGFSQLKGILTTTFGNIGTFITGLLQGAGAAIVGFFTDIGTAVAGPLAKFLGPDLLAGIGVVAATFIAAAAAIAAAVVVMVALIVSTVVDNLGPIGAWINNNLIQPVIGFFTKLYDDLVGHSIIPDLINGIIRLFTVDLPQGILGLLKVLMDSIKGLWTTLKTDLSTLMGQWSGGGILGDIGDAWRDLVTKWTNLLGTWSGGGILGVVGKAWQDFSTGLSTAVGSWDGGGFLGFVGDAFRTFQTKITALMGNWSGGGLLGTLGDQWRKFQTGFQTLVGDWNGAGMLGYVGNAWRLAAGFFKTLIGDWNASTGLLGAIGDQWRLFQIGFQTLIGDWNGAGVLGTLGDAWRAAVGFFKALIGDWNGGTGLLGDLNKLWTGFRDGLAKIIGTWDNTGVGVLGALSQVWSNAVTAFQALIGTWSAGGRGLLGALFGAWTGFVTGLLSMIGAWDGYTGLIGSLHTVFDGLVSGATKTINGILDTVGKLIGKINDAIDAAKRLAGMPTSSSAPPSTATTPPGHAMGTNFAAGGLSLVGEQGPELVNLPRGSSVSTAGTTQGLMNAIVRVTGEVASLPQMLANMTNAMTHQLNQLINVQVDMLSEVKALRQAYVSGNSDTIKAITTSGGTVYVVGSSVNNLSRQELNDLEEKLLQVRVMENLRRGKN